MKKRCGNCAHYFINASWEKLCVDKITGQDGKPHIKVNDRLGMMGDEMRACERWSASERTLEIMEAEKAERRLRMAQARAAKKGGAK